MGNIFSAIWRTVVMQFSNKARHSMNSAISKGFSSAQDSMTGKKKDD